MRDANFTNPKPQRGDREKPRSRFGLVCVATCLVLATSCDRTTESLLYRPNESRMDRPPSQIDDFQTLFANNCSGCHGADGTRGPAPPIGNPLFTAMISEKELTEIIGYGRAGTLMPPFITSNGEGLTPAQVTLVAQGIKEQKLGGAGTHKIPSLVPSYHPTRTSTDAADVTAGAMLFAEYCARCHGEEGRGGSMAGALNEPAFLALTSDRAIRTVIITGRQDLKTKGKDAMPSYLDLVEVTKGNADARWQEIDQLVAYISSWRKEGQLVSAAKPSPSPSPKGKEGKKEER